MADKDFKPFVPADSKLPELTFKAVFLGVLMAVGLGAANAYLGMKAGLTVAATFPAAVVAMAALRLWKGNILEENVARTTASVGEALVAGAIFTIPAFVISGAWEELHYWEATAIMVIGGILGVLFVIILRRTLVVEADLPFPESIAAAEIVKAGQGGQTGASLVFGAMGLAGLWELFKNSNGIHLVRDSANTFVDFARSNIEILGERVSYTGGILFATPSASPALIGVGYIVGMRVSAVLFAGAVMGWLLLVPLSIFLNPALTANLGDGSSLTDLANAVWSRQVRPLAVGTMIVAAFYTLYSLRTSLVNGIKKAFKDLSVGGAGGSDRTQKDLDFKKVFVGIGGMAIATFFLYYYFTQSLSGAVILTAVMVVLGFLFAAVAGYLVALIGSSNNPISGLTLSALLISAVLMVFLGLHGPHGVAGVLGVAGVVCCAAGIAGDMMQDLKVGHILGGTPWKMEFAEMIGVVVAAFVLAFPLIALDRVYEIGSAALPAPQAGLMALMAKGIVGGEMAWPLIIAGMFLAVGLILIGAPSPMLIAVGMYLPFESTAAIFVGGLIKWLLTARLKAQGADATAQTRAENAGILLSSGFIAGESLMAVILAFLVLGADFSPALQAAREAVTGWATPHFWLSLFVYPALVYLLVWVPIQRMRRGAGPAVPLE
ncbi:MAG: oligopeptide transporter, OPT family [Acidobacteriota bacterium]|nr:oligopeptide transporter, OPT family [Acidobacteriota bacterium]MDH3525532.1 oligopeptide transporter, OPT family [Acidobacteriota bacterium]